VARSDFGDCNDAADRAASDANSGRPYIGVYFECCGVYARIYRQPKRLFYFGRCPRCFRTVKVRVGPNGTTARIFRAR